MPKIPTATFANLVCRFGEKFVLLDLADEIVVPAFTDAALKREYASARYFFLNVQMAEVRYEDEDLLVIYGRLVKDTAVMREQVYVPDTGLVPSSDSMPYALSSFFTLILNSHKLVYVGETDPAPTTGQFEAMLQHALGVKYKQYIQRLYSERAPRPTKKELYLEIPHPSVEVRPLASKASVDRFLNEFARVTRVEFRILSTNEEFPMLETYRQLAAIKVALNAKSTKLSHGNPTGLDKEHLAEQIHTSVAAGNQTVRLYGMTPQGATLSGSNDDFVMSLPTDRMPRNDADRAVYLVRLYRDQVQSGILSEDVAHDSNEKVRRLIDQFRSRSNE